MIMRCPRLRLAPALILCWVSVALADPTGSVAPASPLISPTATVSFTWNDILAAAEESPLLAAGRARVDESRAGLRAASVPPNPALSASAAHAEPKDSDSSGTEWSLGVEVPVGWLAVRRPAVEAARAEAQAARQELALARANFNRAQSLRNERINSEKELLEARRDFEEARIRADAAEGRLARLGAAGSGGLVVLRSPADGVVLMLDAVPGEAAPTDRPLVTVGDNSRLWLWADLYESDVARVTADQAKSLFSLSSRLRHSPRRNFPRRPSSSTRRWPSPPARSRCGSPCPTRWAGSSPGCSPTSG